MVDETAKWVSACLIFGDLQNKLQFYSKQDAAVFQLT